VLVKGCPDQPVDSARRRMRATVGVGCGWRHKILDSGYSALDWDITGPTVHTMRTTKKTRTRDVSLTSTVRAALRLACCWGLLAISMWSQDVRSQTPIEYVAPDQSIWTTRALDNGEPDNPLKPVVAALFTKAGIPWTARAYPATRMFNKLHSGEAQFAILVRSPTLDACCLVSRKPLATAEIRAYRRIGTPPTPSRVDLAGRSVITIRGYSYGGLGAF
jgi:hypothetical protein